MRWLDKLKEREYLMTIGVAVLIVANAVLELGIDIEHLLALVGATGTFAVSRGLAKQGAQKALPPIEHVHGVATELAADDDSKGE